MPYRETVTYKILKTEKLPENQCVFQAILKFLLFCDQEFIKDSISSASTGTLVIKS